MGLSQNLYGLNSIKFEVLFFRESIASSSQKLDHLRKNLTSVFSKQEEMDVKLKPVGARQDEMGSYVKTILELLKQKHWELGFITPFYIFNFFLICFLEFDSFSLVI